MGKVKYTEVDLATNADVVVTSGACLLRGYYVNAVMSTHTAAVLDGTAAVFNIPVSSAVGTQKDLFSVHIANGLSVSSDDAGSGKVVICWE